MDMISISNGRYTWQGFALAMDFAIPQGSITAVLGPSGAGKSTLLNTIAGFEPLAAGIIRLAGSDHTTTHPSARPVSLVFQDNNTFANLTAADNVALGLAPNLRLTAEQSQLRDKALQQVGIAHLANRKPGAMSGGERQRIALARVLVRQKPILLLDEAFAALGPALRNEMLDLVRSMQQQKNLTVLMVTHQPEDAKRIADHIMFVDAGMVHPPVETSQFFGSKYAAITRYLKGDD
jgi:thiamine transport system ATP-binding protein